MKSRSHLIVAASAWASRIVLALLQLASVRLLSVGLGQDSYAVYALLVGLSTWFTSADLGIATALQNLVAECRARQVRYDGEILLWAGIAACFGGLLALLGWLVAPWLAGLVMAHFGGVSSMERVASLRVMIVASIATASGSLIYKVWYGEQRGYIVHACQLASGLLAYAGAFAVLHAGFAQPLSWCALVYFGANAALPAIFLLLRLRQCELPHGPDRQASFRRVGRSALSFWGYGLMAAMVLQLDYVLIAFLLGADEVVSYNIYSRLFGLGFFVYTSLLGALWPVLTEKAAQGQGEEMMRLVRRHLRYGLIFILLFAGLVAFFDQRIIHFISPTLRVAGSVGFIAAMGAYYAVRVWSDTFAVTLQSMGKLRPFYVLVPAQAVLSIAAQLLATRWLGLAGVPLGIGFSFILTVAWAAPHFALKGSQRLVACQ